MDAIRRMPLRSILIFGIAAAALQLLSVFYAPYQYMLEARSILLPAVVEFIATIPLALFFLAFWLRVTTPPLLRAGALISAIGAIVSFLLQVWYYAAWLDVVQGLANGRGLRSVSLILALAALVLAVGILLTGIPFLRHPNRKLFAAGLAGVAGGGLGVLSALYGQLTSVLMLRGFSASAVSSVSAVFHLAAWAVCAAFLVLLLVGMPAPKPPAQRPPYGGQSPYGGTPHY